jgi:hypothetical protein
MCRSRILLNTTALSMSYGYAVRPSRVSPAATSQARSCDVCAIHLYGRTIYDPIPQLYLPSMASNSHLDHQNSPSSMLYN